MKIFDRDGKINFIDENNILVGFDMTSSCCEKFGWSITSIKPLNMKTAENEDKTPDDLEDYRFDPNFFEELKDAGESGDDAGVIFCLVNKNCSRDVLYLTLYNSHNGYYSHGFSMENVNEASTLRSGSI